MLRRIASLVSIRPYVVRGSSMEPSFEAGDRLLASRVLDRTDLSRGDVIIVQDPRNVGKPRLKRLVGMPGEELRIFEGLLYLDGVHLPEPYLGGLPASIGLGDRSWQMKKDEYFVLGDNRSHSTDSRDFGPIGLAHIVGRVWLQYWPFHKLRRIVRQVTSDDP